MTRRTRARLPRRHSLFAAATFWLAAAAALADPERNTLVPAGHARYPPSAMPDRIVLVLTEDPARAQTVNWRTGPAVLTAEAQITVAADTPGLHLTARTISGHTRRELADNGVAHHHSVHLEGLQPDTLYAYRVRGLDTWSEWFHFRTAKAGFTPFAFLYFGDAQNSVKSHFSRVIRAAWRELPGTALMLHAGDLVSQREGNHDDEWGEWFEAGGFLHAMVPSIPVTGNHEFVEVTDAAGVETEHLAPAWSAHFTVPQNGPPGLEETVYHAEYQGVLFVALDSTRALESADALRAQTRWLEEVLAASRHRWRIVSQHHPMFSVAIGRDNAQLREHWQPLYERYSVDLVLQGHDHAYGRGANVESGTTVAMNGPVYVVSVAGGKMYLAADDARRSLERIGEDMQLYQIIHVAADRLRFESRTVTGALYDAFDIERTPQGGKRFVDRTPHDAERACANPSRPRPTRCWDGTELVN